MGGGGRTITGNLPVELTSFVGRRRLLQEVKSGLSGSRLLTLAGPGGVGKTRLALRAAAELQRAVPDGAWLVELAGLDEAELVPKAVMTALGLRDQSGSWTTAMLIDNLRRRHLLLVLDNCEHLLDACAVLAGSLLREVADLRILATSRQPLGVGGEQVLPVLPLGLPQNGDGVASPERVLQSEAVTLFVERAAQATGGFAIDDQNQHAVVELLQHLDGMPLAIELAASRLRTLGVAQILDRLGDRFRLLSAGARTAPQRQQSLRATIDWSYELLGPGEAAVLRRLAMFAGSFGLDAAEAVCSSDAIQRDDVADHLFALVERSFVTRVGTTAQARYRLHETMREYSLARLREQGEESVARTAFLDFFAEAVTRWGEGAMGPDVVEGFQATDQDIDNVRAALHHCLAAPAERDRGLRMVGQLVWYLYRRSATEGVYWLDRFLEQPSADRDATAKALMARGLLSFLQADIDGALRCADDAERSARQLADRTTLVWVLILRALTHALAGDVAASRPPAAQARTLAGELDDAVLLAAVALADGLAALTAGDAASAYPIYAGGAELSRRHGALALLGHHLGGAGMACVALGRHDEAARLLEEAITLARRLDDRGALVFRIEDLVCLAAASGQAERAARLSGVVAMLLREIQARVHPPIRSRLDQAEQRARAQLGEARFDRLRQEGEALDHEAAIAYALNERPSPAAPRAVPRSDGTLGRREREVAELVADGLSNKEIAARLFLSERTVETHVYNILNKLGFNSRAQIAALVAAER